MMKKTLLLSGLAFGIFVVAAAYVLYGGNWFFAPPVSPDPIKVEPVPVGSTTSGMRMTVLESGIVGISQETVTSAGLGFGEFSAENLSVSRDGRPVPIHIQDDALFFYAEALTDTLDAPAVYLLQNAQGVAMNTRRALPADRADNVGTRTVWWEENREYEELAADGDAWFGYQLYAPDELEIPFGSLPIADGDATLRLRLWSKNEFPSDNDHHLQVYFNETLVLDEFWDGARTLTLEMTIPNDAIALNNNVVTLNAPGDTENFISVIYVDWVALVYEGTLALASEALRFQTDAPDVRVDGADEETLVFDLSNPAAPVFLSGWQTTRDGIAFANGELDGEYIVLRPDQVVVPVVTLSPAWDTLLTDEARGADYVMIVPEVEGFEDALQPLIEHREAQGLSVAQVSLAQVYDEFGFGRQTPSAIRKFLQHAVQNWQPAPRFALLVGDASWDTYQFNPDSTNKNLLPTHQVFTEYAGYSASDTWFATMSDEDLTPQIALGRFPVDSAEQIATLVRKTIAYETAENAAWQDRALLVADDEEYFSRASDELGNKLTDGGFENQKLHMTDNREIRDSIISALNSGVGILNYVGHGSVRVWGQEKVFRETDADTLSNGSQLPIFTTFTCLNGYFNHPSEDALAETLLWADNGGIVAAVAPSGRSLTNQQTPLANAFYEKLLSGEAETLGEALQIAKELSANQPYLAEVIHTFNLLGDPALRFHRPATVSSQ